MTKGRPPKRYSQAARVHDVVRLIESRRGTTVDELAEATGVGRRTVHRDLVSIQEAGYPLTSEWSDGVKTYRFITGFKDVPPISFTLQELLTLSLLRSQLDLLNGTPFRNEVESLFGKVNSVLPPRVAAHMERIAQVALPLMQGRRDYGASAEHLRNIREALLFQRRITIAYRPAGRKAAEKYRVDPYTLLFQKGGIYLMGYAVERKGLRTFAVERLESIEVGKERFEIPEGFDPGEALEGAFGLVAESPMEVEVRFSAEVAHAVKDRVWHRSQEIREEPGGGVRLKFTAGGKMEIISWLLSYGAHAEVLAPEELRRELGRIATETSLLYNPKG